MSQASMSRGDRRGRTAAEVTQIPVPGWKDVLWRTWQEIGEDHVLLIAAGVAFYWLLALVPALTALVSVYGFFADPVMLERHMTHLQGLIPAEGLSIVREQLRRLAQQGETALGLASLVALALALWSANAGMKSLFEAINVAYDEEEKRGFVRLTAVSLAFTLATIAAALLMIGVVVVLPPIMELLGFGSAARLGTRIGGGALALILITVGLAALYRYGPSRRVAKWRWITPGAALTIVVTLVASGLFSWYVASFGSYNATYGSLGAIFGFMTWLWITAIILVAGAELNAETEHQTRRDTTAGAPRPMGRREATMADTVGRSYSDQEPRAADREAPPRRAMPLARLAMLAGALWLHGRGRRRGG